MTITLNEGEVDATPSKNFFKKIFFISILT